MAGNQTGIGMRECVSACEQAMLGQDVLLHLTHPFTASSKHTQRMHTHLTVRPMSL